MNKQRGFTVIEMLVVLAVTIGIVFGVMKFTRTLKDTTASNGLLQVISEVDGKIREAYANELTYTGVSIKSLSDRGYTFSNDIWQASANDWRLVTPGGGNLRVLPGDVYGTTAAGYIIYVYNVSSTTCRDVLRNLGANYVALQTTTGVLTHTRGEQVSSSDLTTYCPATSNNMHVYLYGI